MQTDWIAGGIGGLIIGAASVLMLYLHGRVAGISGILGGPLSGATGGDRSWRVLFISGIPIGAAIVVFLKSGLSIDYTTQGPLLALAGLLVGIGTRVGSGCTSGHGICGISRRSPRSITATLVFMAVAILTVWVMKRVSS